MTFDKFFGHDYDLNFIDSVKMFNIHHYIYISFVIATYVLVLKFAKKIKESSNEEKIKIEYFIVKRKLHGNPEFPDPRVQIHIPASGKIKLNKTTKRFQEFIEMAFNKDGTHNMGPQLKNPSK
mgnify:CR=1 FL=1